jgi:hypothetical protein
MPMDEWTHLNFSKMILNNMLYDNTTVTGIDTLDSFEFFLKIRLAILSIIPTSTLKFKMDLEIFLQIAPCSRVSWISLRVSKALR